MSEPIPEKLPRPVKPGPGECCGGGSCCPCVWDAYFEDLRKWQQQEGILPGSAADTEPATTGDEIDPDRFYR